MREHDLREDSYIRVGDQDLPMTEYEVYSYEAFRKHIQDELRACPRAELCAFDKEKLSEYFVAIKKRKRQLAGLGEEEILRFQGLIQMDGSPTLAGNLLLGQYPQASLPQLCIVAVAVQGTQMGDISEKGERFIDNERIEGTLPEMLDEALSLQNADAMTERILAFCRTPRSRKELETEFPEMTIVYLMSHKIKPLLDMGRLGQTLPDKPRSKYQRYYTVE